MCFSNKILRFKEYLVFLNYNLLIIKRKYLWLSAVKVKRSFPFIFPFFTTCLSEYQFKHIWIHWDYSSSYPRIDKWTFSISTLHKEKYPLIEDTFVYYNSLKAHSVFLGSHPSKYWTATQKVKNDRHILWNFLKYLIITLLL